MLSLRSTLITKSWKRNIIKYKVILLNHNSYFFTSYILCFKEDPQIRLKKSCMYFLYKMVRRETYGIIYPLLLNLATLWLVVIGKCIIIYNAKFSNFVLNIINGRSLTIDRHFKSSLFFIKKFMNSVKWTWKDVKTKWRIGRGNQKLEIKLWLRLLCLLGLYWSEGTTSYFLLTWCNHELSAFGLDND